MSDRGAPADAHSGTGGSAWRELGRWPPSTAAVWLSLPLLGIALGVLTRPINPYDYWYSLVLGRHVDVTGALPSANLFLYSFPSDTPYLPQAWLGHVALHRLWVAGGHRATALALSLCLLAAWLLCIDRGLRRSRSGRATGLLAAVGVALTFASFNVRTQMFAFPLWAACLWLLLGVCDGALPFRFAWLVVPITALWANLHGSFVLAPLLVAAVAVAAVSKCRALAPRWVALALGSGLAGMATPLGVRSYVYIGRYFGTLQRVSEWERPKLFEPQGWLLLAVLLAVGALLFLRRRSLAAFEALPLISSGCLALAAQRNDFWLASALPVILAPHLAPRLAEPTRPSDTQGWLNALLAAASVATFLALLPGVALEPARRALTATSKPSGDGAGLLDRDHVLDLVARARALARPDSRIFHEQRLGGLVEWTLVDPARPEPVAFVDQRMEIIPESVWREYFDLGKAQPGWDAILERHRIGVLLLHARTQRALVEATEASGWKRVAEESDFVLLARDARVTPSR